jgi:chaperonin cofactor prefoldin
MDKIKNQLAGVAALLGVIAAIGGGFVKYGEIVTKLDALEAAGSVDTSNLEKQVTINTEKIASMSEDINSNMFQATDNRNAIDAVKGSNNSLKSTIENNNNSLTNKLEKEIKIMDTKIKILENQIQELKESGNNPLAG